MALEDGRFPKVADAGRLTNAVFFERRANKEHVALVDSIGLLFGGSRNDPVEQGSVYDEVVLI